MHAHLTYHPFEAIKKWLSDYFPQLDDYVFLYKENQEIYHAEIDQRRQLTEFEKVNAQKWRQLPVHAKWILPQDFPWIASKEQFVKQQLNLMDEEAHQLLLLAFPSPFDGLKDVLAIRFPQQAALFGLQKNVQALTTDEKVLVSDLFHRMCNAVWKEDEEKQRKSFQLQRFNQLKSAENFAERQAESGYQYFFHSLCKEKVKSFFPKESETLHLHDDALATLARLSTNEEMLDALLKDSIGLLLTLSPTENQRYLHEIHVQSVSESVLQQVQFTEKGNDDQRFVETLDRYEQAALRAQQLGMTVSGKNVASCLKPAISPPAITDFLRKYQPKIQVLLSDHPSRWKLIRQNLKPLREIDHVSYRQVVNE